MASHSNQSPKVLGPLSSMFSEEARAAILAEEQAEAAQRTADIETANAATAATAAETSTAEAATATVEAMGSLGLPAQHRLELGVAVEDVVLHLVVVGQLQVLVGGVLDSAQSFLVEDLADNASCVTRREHLSGLDQVLLELLLEELHKPHRLVEVLARANASQSPDLVREVERVVGACGIKLVHELPEQLKAVGDTACLPKLGSEINMQARNDDLVQRICLLLELEEEAVDGWLALVDLGRQRRDVLKSIGRELTVLVPAAVPEEAGDA